MEIMGTFLKPVVLAVLIGLGANVASAATMSGKIEHIYPRHHGIMLDKHVFRMSSRTFRSAPLHRGETVRVTYRWTHGHRWVTAVKTV
jgi:hypothetical protein